jgi:hypothetical protein
VSTVCARVKSLSRLVYKFMGVLCAEDGESSQGLPSRASVAVSTCSLSFSKSHTWTPPPEEADTRTLGESVRNDRPVTRPSVCRNWQGFRVQLRGSSRGFGFKGFEDTAANVSRPTKNGVRVWAKGIMDWDVGSHLHDSLIEFDVLDEHSPICQAYCNDINGWCLIHGRHLAEEGSVGEFSRENARGWRGGA